MGIDQFAGSELGTPQAARKGAPQGCGASTHVAEYPELGNKMERVMGIEPT